MRPECAPSLGWAPRRRPAGAPSLEECRVNKDEVKIEKEKENKIMSREYD